MATSSNDATHGTRRRDLRTALTPYLRIGVNLVLIAVVLYFLWRQTRGIFAEWNAHEDLAKAFTTGRWWLAAAVAIYIVGQCVLAHYWGRLLSEVRPRVSRFGAFRIFWVSALGKYVPSKALVIILRMKLTREPGRSGFWVGIASGYEAISLVVVGAMIALLGLGLLPAASVIYWLGAVAIGGVAVAMLQPGVLGRLSAAGKPLAEGVTSRELIARLRRQFVRSLPVLVVGWILVGVSTWAAAVSIGVECRTVADVAAMTSVTALATVLGFVAVIMPAGIGVREFVLLELLGAQFGAGPVLTLCLLARTIWTAADVGMAGLLYLVGVIGRMTRRPRPTWTKDSKALSDLEPMMLPPPV